MRNGNVLLGLLAGVAAGALVGLLLAPEKGSVTRKKLLKKSGDYAEGLSDKFDQFIDTMGDKFEVAKEEIEKVTAKAKAAREKLNSVTS
jgi:gas vesicle protein